MLKKVRIGDLGEVLTGNTPSKRNNEFYESEDIMFVKPDILSFDIIDIKQSNEYLSEKAREKARIIPKGSLLVSCIGNIGKLGINTEEVAFNQQINAIVHNSKISSSKYLAYLLKYNQKKLESIANAPVVPIINKSQFSDFELLIHEELEVQRKIVEILDKAQELIDRRKEQIEALDELVKSKFIEMFGDPIKNTKNFEMKKLKEISTYLKRGVSPKYVENSSIKVINQKCIYWNELKIENCKYYDEAFKNKVENIFLQKNDVLINSTGTGTLGRAMYFNTNDSANYIADSHVTILRVNNEYVSHVFITNLFEFKNIQDTIYKKCVNGSTNQIELSGAKLGEYLIIVPPIELQNQFAEFVKQVDKLKFEMEKSLKELEDNFNSLMQKAFKGELFN